MFDYQKLKGKIKEVYNSQKAFAEALGHDEIWVSARLNNAIQWRTKDIVAACKLLGIPLEQAHKYFFVEKP